MPTQEEPTVLGHTKLRLLSWTVLINYDIMSSMNDKLRTPLELGSTLKGVRHERKLKAVDIAKYSGRSRDVLNRLEKGQDVTVHSLFDILRAMGLCVRIENAGMPTLEEMQARFAAEDDHPDDGTA